MAAGMATLATRGAALTDPATAGELAGVLPVTEEEVRGLSVPRLRLLIYLLQGYVPLKPGNVSYADRAIRILTAGKEPFFEPSGTWC